MDQRQDVYPVSLQQTEFTNGFNGAEWSDQVMSQLRHLPMLASKIIAILELTKWGRARISIHTSWQRSLAPRKVPKELTQDG